MRNTSRVCLFLVTKQQSIRKGALCKCAAHLKSTVLSKMQERIGLYIAYPLPLPLGPALHTISTEQTREDK